MNAASPIHATLTEPHPPGRVLDDIAESLLAKLAAEPSACRPAVYSDLTDPRAQQLFRPLLACLARKSAQESGTEFSPYGGTLTFVRPGAERAVRITGTFDNRSGAARLAFHTPEPCPPTFTASARGTTGALVEVLCPAVVDHWIDDAEFALASDLDRLDRVRATGATESAVLYCNRIVEAMARDTVGPALDSSAPSLAALISALDRYHRLPGPLRRLLHLLRSIGNDARHAVQPVFAGDDDVAFVILLRWLQWAFCEAASGPRLPSITIPNRPTEALLPHGLARLVDDAATTGEAVLAELSSGHATDGGAILSPMLLAAAAEALLSRTRTEQARVVLDTGLRRFPRDRRLRQLVGLYWSRRGWTEQSVEHLHRARRELEPLLPHGGGVATDEETFGILGGVYKRLSDLDPAASAHWLGKCRDAYRAGWERSGRANDYLGINAATVALWLGSGEVAEVAGPIRDGLAALEERLRTAGGTRPLTYWDQVTWAEAELLLGAWDRAGELYQDAFERFVARTGDIAVSVTQAKRILDHLGESARAAAVLGPCAG